MALDALLPTLSRDLETALLGCPRRLYEINVTEKADHTLLTETDLAVEKLIIDRIREFDPDARIIAEDYLLLVRDIDGVRLELLERIGIRQVEPSPAERELVNGVVSVAASMVGVPKMSGALMVGEPLARDGRRQGSYLDAGHSVP